MNQVQNDLLTADQSEHKDYTNYFETVRTNVDRIDGYRGISKETYQKTGVGFDPEWNNQDKNCKCSPRIIVPCSNSSYEALLVEQMKPLMPIKNTASLRLAIVLCFRRMHYATQIDRSALWKVRSML